MKIELSDGGARLPGEEGLRPAERRAAARRASSQDEVKRPLTDELLFGKLSSGGGTVVDVGADGDKLTFSFD